MDGESNGRLSPGHEVRVSHGDGLTSVEANHQRPPRRLMLGVGWR
jgi:hypothetical protein